MDGPILLATDGRPRSDRAVEYAIALASRLDAALTVLYVADERLPGAVDDAETRAELEADLRAQGRAIVADVAGRVGGVPTETAVRPGVPHRAIIDAASDAGLVVLGREVTGVQDPAAVSTRVITATDVPVLSVPQEAMDPPADGFTSVVVPTDGSEYARRALATVLDWVEPGAIVHGLYVVDAMVYDLADAPRSVIGILREGGEAALADLAATAESESVAFRRHIRRGRVTPVLLDAIAELEPELVAVGARGRSAGSGPLLGSTTQALLRRATVPILASP